jgi:hypothetical protein
MAKCSVRSKDRLGSAKTGSPAEFGALAPGRRRVSRIVHRMRFPI